MENLLWRHSQKYLIGYREEKKGSLDNVEFGTRKAGD
jgi:hypothetical protein